MKNSHHSCYSVPLRLVHKSVAHGSVFEISDEVSVALIGASPAASSSSAAWRRINISVRRWWIVRGARLQSDGRVRVEMTRDSLNGWRDTSLLLVHGGRSLPARPCGGLSIEARLVRAWLDLCGTLGGHSHLMVVAR